MIKGEILNSQLLRIMSETGHTDTICVCDAGLSVPKSVERVDLAWKKNEPGWLEVCKTIYESMVIEKIYLSDEIVKENPEMHKKFIKSFGGTEIEFISHSQLKVNSNQCRAIVRTGEFSPFCNCIFVAGVRF